jgi:hypothetical protein
MSINKIKIGADEIILWLRKNKKAENVPNDEVTGLGRQIHDLIVKQLGGEKVKDNHPSCWAHLIDDKNVGKFDLPKTSAQYELDVDKMTRLYETISKW